MISVYEKEDCTRQRRGTAIKKENKKKRRDSGRQERYFGFDIKDNKMEEALV